jgi:hypothetical protein
MTYDPNDPNRVYTRDEVRAGGDYAGWAIGALLVVLFIGAVFMFVRSDNTTTTSSTAPNRPSATSPANPPSTTGSGATAPAPANPAPR